MNFGEESLKLHKEKGGKIEITSKIKVEDKETLSIVYTPGVAEVSRAISKNKSLARELTIKKNTVAIVSDGSAVLGLGNIGPEAALPVMEGKALIFKEFAGIDAFPICLDTQDTEEIIKTVRNISPVFAGINLEDISAPRCFEIEEKLQDLGIPVFHDDQHGTAIVVLAGLINASKVVGKKINEMKIVISGAGAAGVAITKLLLNSDENYPELRPKKIIVFDSIGSITSSRKDLSTIKKNLAEITKEGGKVKDIKEGIKGVDVFIGVSASNLLSVDDVKNMNKDAIVFALANPDPEILPKKAKEGGAKVVATGRNDFPNQINNALVFPGVFRGAIDARVGQITEEMKYKVAFALANLVEDPEPENIIPDIFDKRVVEAISNSLSK